MADPYYQDDTVTLWLGDVREVLPALDIQPDLVVADPPYGETSLAWDRWPDGWVAVAADAASSMWCFGSMRMLLRRGAELGRYWHLSQDVVWHKPYGSGIAADRFRRVHEHVTHWYRGGWNLVYHQTPRVPYYGPDSRHGYSRSGSDGHTGALKAGYEWIDDGTRLMRSIIEAPTMWRRGAIHKTEKSVELLRPLIEYGCPPGGLVLDPFAGSCSTALAARLTGRRAVLIEADEAMCERAVRLRLAQDVVPLEVVPDAG